MKRSYKEPKKWDWYLCAGLVLAGVCLLFTPWRHNGGVLIAGGIGACAGLNIRSNLYREQSEEKRRQIDLEDRDERNVMIRDRASWLCWQGEELVFLAVLLVLEFIFEIELRIMLLMVLVWLIRTLAHWAVVRWLERKY